MSKQTFYTRGFWLLLVLNILVLLIFLVIIPSFVLKRDVPERQAQQILELNADQQQAFETYVRQHQSKIEELNARHNDLLLSYFTDFESFKGQEISDSIEAQVASVEIQKLRATDSHFEEFRAILNSEQLEKFPEFIEKSFLRKHRRKGRKARKDRER